MPTATRSSARRKSVQSLLPSLQENTRVSLSLARPEEEDSETEREGENEGWEEGEASEEGSPIPSHEEGERETPSHTHTLTHTLTQHSSPAHNKHTHADADSTALTTNTHNDTHAHTDAHTLTHTLTPTQNKNNNDEPVTLFSSIHVHQMTPAQREHCEALAERYIHNCKRFHIPIDASVVIALQTGWHVLQPTRRFTEGSMLPLMGILEENPLITKVNLANVTMIDSRFRAAGNGNSNCRILSHILQHSRWIEELDLSNNGLDDDGIKEICEGIASNKGLKKLNLSSNHFGEEGAKFLLDALQRNESIRWLDLSRNALGFQSINSLLCVCNPKKVAIATNGNYVFEEILNSVSHGIAFLGAVIGANILISDAADQYTNYHFWACVLYSFSLLFLFLSSCLFHSFFMLPTTSRIFQILDHIGIYLVIAGSYTPFLLIALHHHTAARVLLTAEWIAAVLGSTISACSDLNNPVTNVIEVTVFVCMGAGGALIWPTMFAELSREALVLIILGGVFYLVGILFYVLGEFKPIYHAVWHVFVIFAAAIHWFCIYFYIIQVNISDSPTKAAMTDLVDSMSAAASVTASFVNAAAEMRRIH